MTRMEEWRDIDGSLGHYQVSNIGRVRSVPRSVERADGGVNNYPGKILKPALNHDGYPHVRIKVNKKPISRTVHRLVACTFLKKEPGKEVNHKNGVKTDNRVENLEWVTHGDNIRHAVLTGLKKPLIGEEHAMAKLFEEDIPIIRALAKTKHSHKKIARFYSMDRSVISDIVSGKIWKHVR